MDTKKLVVGQHIHMGSGPYHDEGDVVEVLPDGGYVVDATPEAGRVPGKVGWLLRHFDKDGKGLHHEGTYECGRWELGIEE